MIRAVSVSGKDIQRIVYDKLAPACEAEQLEHAVLSMLTFSIILMKPSIDVDTLQEVVMNTSQHIILQLMDEATEDTPRVAN